MRALLFFALLAACGRPDNAASAGEPATDPLASKIARYRELATEVEDAHGFVETDHCDSLLWSSLRKAAIGETFDVRAARDGDGKWHRRPLQYERCYPGHSGSEISRDMFTGLLAYAVALGDKDLAHDVFRYGASHRWVMGEGDLSRTYFTPAIRARYARAILALGGPDYPDRYLPTPEVPGLRGYQAHLQVLAILTGAKANGGLIEDDELRRLREHADREPGNALFAAAASRWDPAHKARALELLLSERFWPADRLPTSADVCESWSVQRDGDDPGLEPCPDEGRTHSGGDFMFAAAVYTGAF